MKKIFLAVGLLLASAAFAQSLPSVPGATSDVPIAVGGHVEYNAQPPANGKHVTGGGFLLFPATKINPSSKYPTYARLSIDTTAGQGCKACVATSYRLGAEQVVAQFGDWITDIGGDYGVVNNGNSTLGSAGFDLREVYAPAKNKWFAFVSFGGQRNGALGVVGKYEVGAGFKLGK